MLDLSIVVVSYNTRDLTLQCLKSIAQYLNAAIAYEIVVVDNCSSDGSQDALKTYAKDMKNVTVICNTVNAGFAAANNAGISHVNGRQILLLNSDTYLVDNSIIEAVNFLDKHPDYFGCGCTLLNADMSIGVSYGRFPGFIVVFFEVITCRFARLRAVVPKQQNCIYDIDYPCGAFFLIKRAFLDKIGLLDEHFFMYCEETDLAKRAWDAGYRIAHYGPAKVVHLRGQSSVSEHTETIPAHNNINLNEILYHSWYYYLKKHSSPLAAIVIKKMLIMFFMAHYFVFTILRNKAAQDLYKKEIKDFTNGWKKS